MRGSRQKPSTEDSSTIYRYPPLEENVESPQVPAVDPSPEPSTSKKRKTQRRSDEQQERGRHDGESGRGKLGESKRRKQGPKTLESRIFEVGYPFKYGDEAKTAKGAPRIYDTSLVSRCESIISDEGVSKVRQDHVQCAHCGEYIQLETKMWYGHKAWNSREKHKFHCPAERILCQVEGDEANLKDTQKVKLSVIRSKAQNKNAGKSYCRKNMTDWEVNVLRVRHQRKHNSAYPMKFLNKIVDDSASFLRRYPDAEKAVVEATEEQKNEARGSSDKDITLEDLNQLQPTSHSQERVTEHLQNRASGSSSADTAALDYHCMIPSGESYLATPNTYIQVGSSFPTPLTGVEDLDDDTSGVPLVDYSIHTPERIIGAPFDAVRESVSAAHYSGGDKGCLPVRLRKFKG